MSRALRRPLAVMAVLGPTIAGVGIAVPSAHATSGARTVPATQPQLPLAKVGTLSATTGLNGQLENMTGDQGPSFTGVGTTTQFSWSADGSSYVAADGGGGIFVGRTDEAFPLGPGATFPSTVVNNTTDGAASRVHPTWINGGVDVAYGRAVDAHHYQLFQANSAGGRHETPLFAADTGFSDTNPSAAANGLIAFERNPLDCVTNCATGSIAVYDPSDTAHPVTIVATHGSKPAISPDGKTVAYIVNGQIFTAPTDGSAPAGTLLPGSPTTAELVTWSPDGQQLGFAALASGSQTNYTVYTVPAAGGTATPTASKWTQSGAGFAGLSWAGVEDNSVVRFAGTDRFSTTLKTSQYLWRNNGVADPKRRQATSAVITRSDDYADALGGSALAAQVGGPLLLTPTDSLRTDVSGELTRILPAGSTVYVLGGEQAMSPKVVAQLEALHYTVVRIGGTNRFDTAAKIATVMIGKMDPATLGHRHLLIASGTNFPDALSAGAAAGARGDSVVLLTSGKTMPPETRSWFPNNGYYETDAIGGDAVAALKSQNILNFVNYAGSDRYDTSAKVAHGLVGASKAAGVATGADWPDALAGGAAMGTLHSPLLLTNPANLSGLNPSTVTSPPIYLNQPSSVGAALVNTSGSVDTALIFGGTSAVGANIPNQVGWAISLRPPGNHQDFWTYTQF